MGAIQELQTERDSRDAMAQCLLFDNAWHTHTQCLLATILDTARPVHTKCPQSLKVANTYFLHTFVATGSPARARSPESLKVANNTRVAKVSEGR